MATETRFAYAGWDNINTHQTSAVKHVGLIFSRVEPWDIKELVGLINVHKPSKEFLRYPDHPYFIIPCPPTKGADLSEHNLFRTPVHASFHRVNEDSCPDSARCLIKGNCVGWAPTTSHPPSGRKASHAALINRNNAYKTSDSKISVESEEWRYIVTPVIDTALHQELHPSTLQYTFTMVWDGHLETFDYQEMWGRCPIVQGIFQGYAGCPRCDLRGPKCTRTWFLEALKARTPLTESDLQVAVSYNRREEDGEGVPYVISGDWDKNVKTLASNTVETVRTGDPLDQGLIGGVTRLSAAHEMLYVSRGKCRPPGSPMIMNTNDYTPAQTTLVPAEVVQNAAQYQRNAEKSAATKNRHTKVCGVGKTACVLREQGCVRWRKWGPCKTRWESPEHMLQEGAKVLKDTIVYTEFDFAVAFHFAGHEFCCVNPETGRRIRAQYGGLHIQDGKVYHQIVREGSGGYVQELCHGTWREVREFVRKWAPNKARDFWYAQEEAREVTVTDEAKTLYAECATLGHLWSYSMYMGHCAIDITCVSADGHRPAYTADNTSITVDTVYGHSFYFRGPRELKQELDRCWFSYIPD